MPMIPRSRRGWTLLVGSVVTVVLASMLAWSLPTALARDERGSESTRLALELRRWEARGDDVRADGELLDEEFSESARLSEEHRTKLDRLQAKVKRLQKRVRERTKRIDALDG